MKTKTQIVEHPRAVEYQARLDVLSKVQKTNPPSSNAWQEAHHEVRAIVLEWQGVDIDGRAACKGGVRLKRA